MIRPPSPCSRIRIAAARAQVKVPRRWVLITTSKSSSLIFHSTRSRSTPGVGDDHVESSELDDGAVDELLRGGAVPDRGDLRDGAVRRRR